MSLFKKILGFIPRKINRVKEDMRVSRLLSEHGSETRYWLTEDGVDVGEYTYGIPKIVQYSNHFSLTIGKFCSISNNVEIIFGGQHHYEYVSQYAIIPQLRELFNNFEYSDKPTKPVVIGNDVWIGRNVTILQGVNIGDGAVIGTNSVVAKDIPPYAIAVGNPVKIIKYRFSEDQIAALERINWWDWPIERIKENFPLIMSGDIELFIQKFDKPNS